MASMTSVVCPCGRYCQINPSRWSRRLLNSHKRALAAGTRIDSFDCDQLLADWTRCDIDPTRCVYCHNCARCLDHLVPIRRGGPHSIENLVPSCIRCNNKKGGLLLHQWIYITRRIAYPIPQQVVALTARSLKIKQELEREGVITEYGNPPNQEIGPGPGNRLGQKPISQP